MAYKYSVFQEREIQNTRSALCEIKKYVPHRKKKLENLRYLAASIKNVAPCSVCAEVSH